MSVPDEGYPRNASYAIQIQSRAYINNNIISNELLTAINWISTVLFVELLNVGDNVDVKDDI